MDYRELFFKIHTVDHLHRKCCDEIVKEADLFFGQFPILGVLHRHGPSSQKEVAKELHVSPPSIANSVKRLEKKGLLTCEVSEDDRRSHVLQLTPKGLEAHQYCLNHFQEIDTLMCDNISQEDLIVFERVVNSMIDNLKKEKEKGENND